MSTNPLDLRLSRESVENGVQEKAIISFGNTRCARQLHEGCLSRFAISMNVYVKPEERAKLRGYCLTDEFTGVRCWLGDDIQINESDSDNRGWIRGPR